MLPFFVLEGASGIEGAIGGTIIETLGAPLLVGILIMIITLIFLLVKGVPLSAGIVALVPAAYVAGEFIPELKILVWLAGGLALGYALIKLFGGGL